MYDSGPSPCPVDQSPLAAGEPPPFDLIEGPADGALVLVCDHASNSIPPSLQGLGLDPAELGRHIAWDIGAADLTRRLAASLGATAVLGTVSRLVVDLNRRPTDPTAMAERSDGTEIPGNQGLAPAQVEQRLARWHAPYHQAVAGAVGRVWARGQVPVVVALHSFTPSMNGQARPWHAGVLWNRDGRMALPLIHGLRTRPGLMVGDNEPYSGRIANYTLDVHAGAAGFPHVSIEVRQDLIAHPAGVAEWADLLHQALIPLLADSGLYRLCPH